MDIGDRPDRAVCDNVPRVHPPRVIVPRMTWGTRKFAVMSVVVLEKLREAAPALSFGPGPVSVGAHTGRQRRAEPVTNRVRRDGKFFRLGEQKFYVKGVTYGPFAPNADGDPLPSREHTRKDFEQIV